jgi:hypothetical protein
MAKWKLHQKLDRMLSGSDMFGSCWITRARPSCLTGFASLMLRVTRVTSRIERCWLCKGPGGKGITTKTHA